MNRTFAKRLPLAFALALALALIVTLGFAASGSVARADSSAVKTGELTIGHLSDIHYFPLEYCYQDVNADDYYDSDFYYSMTGDTKLVLESGVVLHANIERIYADAVAGTAPVYFFASGDLTKNGERIALADVANALRGLQNKVRALGGKYENFQIFAAPGNHDLYNGSGALYDKNSGKARQSDGVTAAQFALLFAGLGYPDANLTGADGDINLTGIYPNDYWSTGYTGGYIASKNAPDIKFTYFSSNLQSIADNGFDYAKFINIGHASNQISFNAEITDGEYKDFSFFVMDATDREISDSMVPVQMSKAEFDALVASLGNKNAAFSAYEYYVIENGAGSPADGAIDPESLTLQQLEAAFAAGREVFVNIGINHISGGRLTEPALNWMANLVQAQRGTGADEKTFVATYHQNTLPHFDQEDDILKDFVLYNWEHTAKFLLQAGIRYTLTGHMHSSDVAVYTDAEGRTLYDMETGSSVSYDSPLRYMTITRYDCDGKLGEKFVSSIHILKSMKELASDNIFAAAEWDDDAYQTALNAYEASPSDENWAAVIAANPEYYTYTVRYDHMSSLSYNEYIQKDIYGQLVDRMLDHFINERMIDSLRGMLSGMLVGPDSVLPNLFSSFAPLLNKMALYAVDEIIYNLYPDGKYPLNGKLYDGGLEYVKALANEIVGMKFGNSGEELTVGQIIVTILTAHTSGTEPSPDVIEGAADDFTAGSDIVIDSPNDPVYRARYVAALKDFAEKCEDGSVIEELLSRILNPLLYNEDSLINTLLNHHFDFTKATDDQEEIKVLTSLISLLKSFLKIDADINPSDFVLGPLLDGLSGMIKNMLADSLGFTLTGDTVPEMLNNFLDSYLVDSFYVGIGGILRNIAIAFATDDTPDVGSKSDLSVPLTLAPYQGYGGSYSTLECGQLSYISSVNVPDSHNPATQQNGRLPGNLTANFDNAAGTGSVTLSYYTAEEISTAFELYDENGTLIAKVENAVSDMTLNSNSFYASSVSADEGKLRLDSIALPQYIPLIDLGILCIQHTAVYKEVQSGDKTIEVMLNGLERDAAPANSVIYWNRHTVRITGLEAGKTYNYKVYGRYQTSAGDFKQYDLAETMGVDGFSIATAPSADTTDFDFLAIADLQGMIQGMYDESYKAALALNNNPATNGYGFILNAGDMTDNGKNFAQWQMVLNTYTEMFANTSTFLTAGNHENGTNALNNFYNYTPGYAGQSGETGLAYSFNYANALVVVLDTNDSDADSGLGSAQFEWLKQTLSSSAAKWKFVLMHKSLYSGGAHSYDGEIIAMRNQLVPVFNEYGVDAVFAGHDHTYTVTELIAGDGNPVRQQVGDWTTYNGDGVLFVTLGTMGTKFYNYTENPDVTPNFSESQSILGTLDSQTFGYVSVRGDKLTYTGYAYDAAADALRVIGSLSLSDNQDYIPSSVKDWIASACPSATVYIPFFASHADNDQFAPVTLPEGWTVRYTVDGKTYESFDKISLNSKSAEVKVYAVGPDAAPVYVTSITLAKNNYDLAVELFIIGAIWLVGFSVLIACIIKKKKDSSNR